jgi:hypothetical protein
MPASPAPGPPLCPSELQHLILTRFNIWNPFSGSDDRRLSEDYLTHRLALFERYCLPSVAGQTCDAFRWVIFFDEETPSGIKKKVAASLDKFDHVFPVYMTREDGVAFDSRVWPFIPSQAIDDRRYLLTTRLDNDDAVATHFVQTIQASVRLGDDFLNLPRGYRYVQATNRVYESVHPSNTFASRIEDRSRGEPATVLNVDHMQIEKSGRVRQVRGDPCWVIVVHETNVSNRYTWSERRVPRSALRRSFLMPGEVQDGPESRLGVAAENVIRRLRLVLLSPLARAFRGLARRAKKLVSRNAPATSP